MLFLLKDDQGRALLMAQANSKAEADKFGRNHLPEFCGDSIEIELDSRIAAEEFWGVRTIKVVHLGTRDESRRRAAKPTFTSSLVWVRGPQLPEDVEADGLLTPEDHRDLTLDHIARTSDLVAHIEIRKWA